MKLTDDLEQYKANKTQDNYQNLCVSVADFCKSLYASASTQTEKEIFKKIFGKVLP